MLFPPKFSTSTAALSAEVSSVWRYERAIYLSHTVDITNAQLPEWIQAMSQETAYILLAGFSFSIHEKPDYVSEALVTSVS